MSKAHYPAPKLGDGATIYIGSDRYPATVITIVSKGVVWVQRDKSIAYSNSTPENQRYAYEFDAAGKKHRVSQRKDGPWKITHRDNLVCFGERRAYFDPSF